MKKLIPLFFVVLVLVLAVPGCGGSETAPADPSLGDTWTRPADEMVMVYVPAGEFEMGTDECEAYEKPVHTVGLDAFWIDQTEVTNAQFAGCVEAGACDPPENSSSDTRDTYYGDGAYDDYPVIGVEWDQAVAYCDWAGARLPTEAEWEYAARGPEGRRYPWGNSEPDCEKANFRGCAEDTTAVGSYPGGASWCGALDMSGNVWEWVADYEGPYSSERESNPTGPASGGNRVRRGGAWYDWPNRVLSALRVSIGPRMLRDIIGIRCARGYQQASTLSE
jgi:serine/threonine-protein kinase